MAMEVDMVIDGAHDGKVLCTAFNKARNELYTGGEDHLVKVWNIRTGELVNTMRGHKGWVTCLIYIPQLKYIISGSVDGTIVVWTENYLEVQVIEFSGGVFCLAYSARKSYVIAGGNATFALYKAGPVNMRQLVRYHNRQRMMKSDRSRNRALMVDDNADVSFRALDTTNTGMIQFKGTDCYHTDVIKTILTTPNGRFITAGFDHRIVMWDVEKLKEMKPFARAHTAAVTQLGLDTFSNYILSSSYDGTVRSWNMEGRCLDTFEVLGDAREISSCYVAAVKQYWLCSRNKVISYDPRSPSNVSDFTSEFSRLNEYDVCRLEAAQDSDLIVGISRSNELILWRYNPMAPHRTLTASKSLDPSAGWVEHLLIVRMNTGLGGEHIFTASNDGHVVHWALDDEQNTDTYEIEEEFNGHEGSVLCLVWIEEYEAVMSCGDDATIRIWYLDRREREIGEGHVVPTVMYGHEDKITGMVLLPEDGVLVSVSNDRSIRRWELETMTALPEIVENAHDHGLTCVDYSPSLHLIATTGGEPVAKVWDADDLKLVAVLDGHRHEATQVCWAAFKECWVTVSDDSTIRLWDKDGVEMQCFDYYGDSGLKLYVDNINKRMLMACMDRLIRVYDLEDAHPIMKYKGHTDTIRCLGYIEEFGWYISGAWDKSIRLWLSENQQNKFSPLYKKKKKDRIGQTPDSPSSPVFQEDDVDEKYRSTYERANPLTPPKTLKLGGGNLTVLRTMGLAKKGKKGSARDNMYDLYNQNEDSPVSTTGLGAKLAELESRLNPQEPDYEDDMYDYY